MPDHEAPGRTSGRPGGFRLLAALVLITVSACAPARMPGGPGETEPRLAEDHIVAGDGMELPLRTWLPEPEAWPRPRAVILALHGFNDHSRAFEEPAKWWAARGIATYAYDQRGFGAGAHPGLWAGSERLTADLREASGLVAARHPEAPLYLLGESMGGAVVIVTLAEADPPPAAGAILSAPAVWSRETMPLHLRMALWLAERFMPWARFTGGDLEIRASDNIEMLRALGRDPLVIKGTRVDAMAGLTDLMSEALAAAPRFSAKVLLLYGDKDEVVPREPVLRLWRELPATAGASQRNALYAEGWHMLLRDLQADTVLNDIASWIEDDAVALPSGADRRAEAALDGLDTESLAQEDEPASEPAIPISAGT